MYLDCYLTLLLFEISFKLNGNRKFIHAFVIAGNWYPWGLLYVYNGVMSNTLEDLTASFQRVIGIFNAAGAPVKFQLNINNNNGNSLYMQVFHYPIVSNPLTLALIVHVHAWKYTYITYIHILIQILVCTDMHMNSTLIQ